MINASAIEFHSLLDEELVAKQREDASIHDLHDYLGNENVCSYFKSLLVNYR